MLRKAGQDRFLVPRNGILYYWRRVPKTLVDVDSRAPFVRHSLKTDDLAKARSQRDILEKADNELWAAMLLDGAESMGALGARPDKFCDGHLLQGSRLKRRLRW